MLTLVAVLHTSAGDAGAAQPTVLDDAQRLFYNGRYADAATIAASLCTSDPSTLASCELHISTLLFQIRRGMGNAPDREKAFTACAPCAPLLTAFVAETRRVQGIARARVAVAPEDESALFFLGKLDLNYVWLQLGTLGRKTGWDEYWEARRSLDKVLKANPGHVRAKVARAWIDYIVDTKMPWGTEWLLGGGSRKRALIAVREAAHMESDFFTRAEAAFALWDMHVRERDMTQATEVARRLAHDFPDNFEVAAFLKARQSSSQR